MEINQKELLSVGIDVGTTTSHLVFSKLIIRNNPFTSTNKFDVSERKILYKSKIFLTPLKNENTSIDFDALSSLLLGEYEKAGFNQEDIETGAVIITGESARKENAEKIVEKVASEGGKFVAAAAGPNFEALISAHGSGAVDYSKKNKCKLIHSDIGGGTTKITIIDSGQILVTTCINIGGRLIAYNKDMEITRLEETGKLFLNEIGLNCKIGDVISKEILQKIVNKMGEIIKNILTGSQPTHFSKQLYTTESFPNNLLDGKIFYSFSGGVSEYIYGCENRKFNDLGYILGEQVRKLIKESHLKLVSLPERIRATVIGVSAYTVEISGSTTFISSEFKIPIKNVPVAKAIIDKKRASATYVENQISVALRKIDINESSRSVAIAFEDPVKLGYQNIKTFTYGLAKALSNYKNTSNILVFGSNVGASIGHVLTRETGLQNFLSIDEISLNDGDYIDVGEALNESSIYPVILKSLVFR